MQTITQKKKLSKGTWVLIFLLIAALITAVVLAAVGVLPINWLTDPYDMDTGTSGMLVGYAMFGTSSWINAAIMIVLPLVGGMVFMWIIYRWFKGQQVTVAAGAGVYTPQTGASASTNSGTTTEIN